MKKMTRLLLLFLFLAGLLCPQKLSIYAAGVPVAFLNTPPGTVINQGDPFALEFTVYREYQQEKLHVELYYGTTTVGNSLVASSTPSYSSSGSSIVTQTITLDTSNYAPGVYTVKYYMEYYTFYSWHTGDASTRQITITSSKYDSFPASQNGFSKETAYTPEFGKKYIKTWSGANGKDLCLNKIELTENGIVTFTMSAPQTSTGNSGVVELMVYADDGTVVGGSRLGYPRNALRDTYTYTTCLREGTYYYNLKPSFSVTSGAISSDYSFSFEAHEDIELESNNSRATATKLTKDKMALAYFGTDYSYDVDEDDWFEFDVEAGETVSLWLDNYEPLEESTAILTFQTPDGDDTSLFYSDRFKQAENGKYRYVFTPSQSGTCTLHLHNYSKESIRYEIGFTTELSKEALEARANQAAADAVAEKINALPAGAGLADEAAVAEARAAYNALSDDQKALVDNAVSAKLVSAENQVAKEKKIAEAEEASQKALEAAAAESADKSSAKNVETAILKSKNSDGDAADSTFRKLRATAKKVKSNQFTVSWTKVSGAGKYVVYGNACGKKNKMIKLGETKGKSMTVKKMKGAALKKGTYYKVLVVAVKTSGDYDQVIAKSKVVHVATTGGKVTNAKKVTVSAKKATVKKGKTYKIKASVVSTNKKLKIKKHRGLSYESSNPKIASVSKKGVIKGLAKGSATIYVYAQNGVYAAIKVTVK